MTALAKAETKPDDLLSKGPDAGTEVKAETFPAIFQIPNKFYEKDGRVTDSSGKDWDELWGDLLEK